MGEEMTRTIDQWAAEACGVIFSDGAVSKDFFWECGCHSGGGWSIEKLECKEAFRDWWLSGHSKRAVMFTKFGCLYLEPGNAPEGFNFNEIACITAIYEAEQ